MSEPTLTINTVLDNRILEVPFTSTTTAEDVCIHICKILNIGPLARHLFALRISTKNIFLTPSAFFGSKYLVFDFRIRFKVSKLQNLRRLDIKAYDYYFHQTRLDVLENRVPDIVFEKCKRELVGLGITDMYRVMLEKDVPKEVVENDYKKYIPKEVLKRHAFFIKKPIRETLGKLQRTKHDVWFVKEEYLNQLNILSPDYLSETYKAVMDQDGSAFNILVKVSPGDSSSESSLPEVKYRFERKTDWQMIGSIEEISFVSIRIDGTVEISRTTDIPFYLKFNSLPVMWSFISHLDGYYRLTCKWTFNICRDATTPSLQKLYMMKCHGPVGGEFSYAKLEEKRSNRPGCFIIRESETKYNQYFIDVCVKNSSKPKTFKLEKNSNDEYVFNDDPTIYKSMHQLVAAYKDPNGSICLKECLPPSENDISPLLLCQKDSLLAAALADASALTSLVPSSPLCIDCKDLQLYKRTYCYVISLLPEKAILKKHCHIRKCKSQECRMAGTGNDYTGVLNIARSLRYCEPWQSPTQIHPHALQYMNESLFPDVKLEDVSSFCRNPSRNAIGSWCYTVDPSVPQESCLVKDCDKPEECVIILMGRNEVQKKDGSQGLTIVHKSMWKITKTKKIEVAMKILKQDFFDKHLKDFLDLAGRWAFLQSQSIVRLYGVTLTRNISMVMEYFRLGPLNLYLQKNKNLIKIVDLVEASSNLASALWYLSEKQIVHGKIRCRKLMVHSHDGNSFRIKLSDPGIHTSYGINEVHWIPVEYYGNVDYAKISASADIWAFATTLWEIFTYGEEISVINHNEAKEMYRNGKILPKPPPCPENIYQIMKECWHLDSDRRKQPQAIMRDINQILYQVYNSRRIHSYAKINSKSRSNGVQSVSGSSMMSVFSSKTESTCISNSDDVLQCADDEELSVSSSFSGRLSECALLHSQDMLNYEETLSCDFSNILSNFNFSTATTSLDSINSMQSIFELDGGCNVVLQGRIGQGFYGEVYKATLEYYDNEIEKRPRQVAVKKLKSSGISSSLQDFEREIDIMKTLQHPNIIEILGVVRDPEILLVMEFVQHGSLQSYLKIYKESLHTKQLLKYALDIAKGMNYLGQKNIVHRDLAARNILVVDENHVKISDFGLAQVMGTNDYYILKTNRELPIKWYAPESLRDGKFSTRSDVWSYGVTMCEMFDCGDEPKLININQEEEKAPEQEVLLKALDAGARFPCPHMCPQVVYIRLIYPCWQNDPHLRPSFAKLVAESEDLLTHY